MRDLHAAAYACLMCADPARKTELTADVARHHAAGELAPDSAAAPPVPVDAPGRPERPRLVSPRELAHRGLGSAEGRAALVHAVALDPDTTFQRLVRRYGSGAIRRPFNRMARTEAGFTMADLDDLERMADEQQRGFAESASTAGAAAGNSTFAGH